MTLEFVANEDLKVQFTNTAGPPDLVDPVVDPGIDVVMVVPTLSANCALDDKAIATKEIILTWTVGTGGCPFTSPTHTFVAGAGSISPQAVFVKANNELVLRDGDTGTCVGSIAPLPPVGGWVLSGTPVGCACTVEISDAGQDRAKAE